MGHGDLSHTEVSISHEAKLSGIYETRCGINPISHGWLMDKYFILSGKAISAKIRGYIVHLLNLPISYCLRLNNLVASFPLIITKCIFTLKSICNCKVVTFIQFEEMFLMQDSSLSLNGLQGLINRQQFSLNRQNCSLPKLS